jgi:integrase
LAEARDAWREARQEVAKGRDPARKDGKAATDFRGVFEEWLLRDQGENRSKALVARKLEKDVLPFWQHRPISDIGRRDALDVIDRIADRGAVITARRVHAHLHRLFKWAVGRGIIDFNPLASVPKPGSETKRDRVLSDEELVAVWKAADEIGHPYGSIIKLLILTGCRREEIGQLKWSEIDGDKIVLGGQRTKNGEAHIIPLSAPACAIIEDLPRIAGCEFVITHNGVKPVAAWGRAKALIDAIANIAPWVVHDLRRTTATGLQKLGTPLQVTEAVLGHTGGSRAGVVGIYQRHDYANEKRTALEVWGAHVMALVEGRAPRQDLRLPPSDEDQQTPLLAADGS